MKYIIGVDGGGTSTVAFIASIEGKIVAKEGAGPSNPNTTEKTILFQTYKQLFSNLQNKVSENIWGNIIHIYIGASGAEHRAMKEVLYKIIYQLISKQVNVTVDNDAIIALNAGTIGRSGIVQICGTGSVTFGVNRLEQRGRVGGWGHFITEDCGGYYIGKSGLEAAFNAFDKAGPETILVDYLTKYFNARKLSDIVKDIYHTENPKKLIAHLAKIVFTASIEGDRVSNNIINNTGRNIGNSIINLNEKLFTLNEKEKGVDVILIGSVFKQLSLLEKGMKEVLNQYTMPINYYESELVPAVGAIICGMKEEGIIINESVTIQLKNSVK